MTAHPLPTQSPTNPAKAPKVKRRDAYIARITVTVPVDMTDAQTLTDAMDAVKKIKDSLPANATVEMTAGMAKI